MNKLEIIEVAQSVKQVVIMTGLATPEQEALIAAAELLKQVEVVEVGSEPMVGDVMAVNYGETGEYTDYVKWKSHNRLPAVTIGYQIIQRNGKPVITKGSV